MSSPIPPIKVDILAGQNTAAPELQRTGTEIARVAAGASSGLSPIQRLSKAMVLAEGREGSLVIRELRGSIATLAGEAVGATGGLGRLGATLGEFAIGGATGLAVVAGIAAIGYAWKKADEAQQLAADNAVSVTERLKRVFGSVMKHYADEPAEGLAKLRQAVQETQSELRQAGIAPLAAQTFVNQVSPQGLTVSVPLNNPAQEHAAAITAADDKARAAQQALNDALKAAGEAGDRATDALKRQATAEQAAVAIREHAVATGQDETLTLIQLAGAAASAQAAVMGLDDAHTASLVAAAKRLERLKEENKALEAQRNLLTDLQHIESSVADFFKETPFFQDTLRGIKVPNLGQLEAQESARQATADVSRIEKQGNAFAFGFDQSFFDGVQQSVSEALATTPGKDKTDFRRIGQESLAEIAALRSGDTGAGLAGAGSLVSTLGAEKTAGGLGIAGLGPVGIGLSLAGTAFSLFDHSAERRHREMLAALKRIEEKAVPEGRVVQPIFVGATPANASQVAYEAGRFTDRDGVYRGVGQP